MMTTLYIIRGIPGAGKTTIASILEASLPHAVAIAADDWMVDDEGNYRFDPAKLPMAHAKCQMYVEETLSIMDVIVHNTFIREWELQPYLDIAKKLNATVHVLLCESGWRDNVSNVHAVPEHTIDRMRNNIKVKP